ncbi:MAG: Omp28-related outer membrane protein [Sphingobacteriaceae bacterium]|nr:Omp28-related outer membrane protein [Sphingobacteriaceae bacterium]
MKKIGLILGIVMLVLSCDKVKNPLQNPDAITNCTVSPHFVKTDSNTTKVNHRIVLVEDYTGHTCGNCPRAAEEAENIQNKYGDSVVVLAIHAGTQFSPPKLPDFPEDFRTSVGTDWDGFFGFSAAGLPKGSVNRDQTPFPQPRNAWDGLVSTALNWAPSAKLELTTWLDTSAMLMRVDVKTTFITSWSNTTKLVVVMSEDSIIARQKDYAPPVGSTVENGDEIPDYLFMHMLRGSINGSWGEEIKNGPSAIGDVVRKSYNCYEVKPWNSEKKRLKNMSVVAILFDESTREILQVDKLKIK